MVGLVIVGVALLFLYAALWIGGFLLMAVVEVGELVMAFLIETVGRVLGVTFGDKAKERYFPRLVGVGAATVVGGIVVLCFFLGLLRADPRETMMPTPPFGGEPVEWVMYGLSMSPFVFGILWFALVVGAVAGFLVWTTAEDYQREKYAKQEKE